MLPHISRVLFATTCVLAVASCSLTKTATDGKSKKSVAADTNDAEHLRLARAEIEVTVAEAKAKALLEDAQLDLEEAKSKLAEFDASEAPLRIAREQQSLATERDQLSDEKENLAQLEMTYAESELGDKTKEIVLNRSRRRAARAEENLATATKAEEALEKLTLPRERNALARDVAKKQRALESARREGESVVLGARADLLEARTKAEASGKTP